MGCVHKGKRSYDRCMSTIVMACLLQVSSPCAGTCKARAELHVLRCVWRRHKDCCIASAASTYCRRKEAHFGRLLQAAWRRRHPADHLQSRTLSVPNRRLLHTCASMFELKLLKYAQALRRAANARSSIIRRTVAVFSKLRTSELCCDAASVYLCCKGVQLPGAFHCPQAAEDIARAALRRETS